MYFHRSESHILVQNNKIHKLLELGAHTVHQERVKPLLLFIIDLAFQTVLWQEKRVREYSSVFALQQKQNSFFIKLLLPHIPPWTLSNWLHNEENTGTGVVSGTVWNKKLSYHLASAGIHHRSHNKTHPLQSRAMKILRQQPVPIFPNEGIWKISVSKHTRGLALPLSLCILPSKGVANWRFLFLYL